MATRERGRGGFHRRRGGRRGDVQPTLASWSGSSPTCWTWNGSSGELSSRLSNPWTLARWSARSWRKRISSASGRCTCRRARSSRTSTPSRSSGSSRTCWSTRPGTRRRGRPSGCGSVQNREGCFCSGRCRARGAGGCQGENLRAFPTGPRDNPSPGCGIGLSLVARFAELHRGRAWVESRPGGGASFRVFIPSHGRGS
ncbi:MAG TPA: hypothetical protein DIT48_05030 [Actinobacteria bacterium]|nr:hypothetical protein [Actinomycetota bacterium]